MAEDQREFVRYVFFKVQPEWRRLTWEMREAGKQEFRETVESFRERMLVRSFGLMGTRGDVDFMLQEASFDLDDFQELATRLASTGLGVYLTTPYAYLAMTRRSPYIGQHRHEGQEGARLSLKPGENKYLFVYPFVKSRPWYKLSAGARQGMMNEHIAIGHKFPSVKINTSYSFGIDDQEFVLAFETESPSDFLDLVVALRESEASAYTVRDTPTFTCIAMDIKEALDSLGGLPDGRE